MLTRDAAAVAMIRASLDKFNWNEVCERVGFTDELRQPWTFRIGDAGLTATQETLGRLLIEGGRVPVVVVEAALATAFVDALTRTGLGAIAQGDIVLPEFSLLALRDKYLAVSRRTVSADVLKPIIYAGPDSLMMADRASRYAGGTAVDLCTGAGLLALKIAERFDHVDACEIAPSAADAAQFNVALNGLSEKIFVTAANALKFEPSGPVDFIIANPPFMPRLTDDPLLSFAAGGLNGYEFALQLMQRALSWLRPGGRALVLTGTLGGLAKAEFLRLFAELADAHALDISAVNVDVRPTVELPLIAGLPQDLAEDYRAVRPDDAGAAMFEAYLLIMRKTATPQLRLLDRWRPA
ncbi:MAG TPA: methyltransferase [Rhizomicrobium sp.]|nr:methyltransferase [Rhizomicrobium sp.]